jgi:hypothetical protein
MKPLKSGDRIFYVGSKWERLWGVPLTVHRVHSYYLSAVKPDGYYTTWLDFVDVVLDEGEDRCDG